MARALALTFACAFAAVGVSSAAETCKDVYKQAFKGSKRVAPAEVGDLYFKYCKKSMRVSSAKSMDELCKPLVKKVADKMLWVPKETEVTPEIVCKTVDQLKADFPEHAASMAVEEEKNAAQASKENEAKDRVSKLAKDISVKLADEIKDAMKAAGETLMADLKKRLGASLLTSTGKEGLGAAEDKVISVIAEAVEIGHRGLETKITQKKDEALKFWVGTTLKELREAQEAAAAKPNKDEM